jgi:hypothetical protein
MLETVFIAKTLIEDLFNNEHDMRKSELNDFVEDFVLFRDNARDDFNDCLINLVLDDLEKIDVLQKC